jgi:hypothetical protein
MTLKDRLTAAQKALADETADNQQLRAELARTRAENERLRVYTATDLEVTIVRERERSAAETAGKCRLEAERLKDANASLRNQVDTLRTQLAAKTKEAAEARDGQQRLSLSCADAIRKAKESANQENHELRREIETRLAAAVQERDVADRKLALVREEWKELAEARQHVRDVRDVLDGLLE